MSCLTLSVTEVRASTDFTSHPAGYLRVESSDAPRVTRLSAPRERSVPDGAGAPSAP